ncbi:uncharacterized protein LOC121417659 [Lytechinus variegatus]|uniref:uncharacterized protein LOC121417659 n=1 Tax=Lytechinus variegatus TaxID=7654 RepID=UPI001BB1FD37|nr:uncharacterized protein LOC121417659 [Lytechinus variegatus]
MQLVLIQFLFFTLVLKNVFLTSAMDIYVQPGTDVTIPCSINITPSNIQALYWQKVTNSTEGFETLYSFSKFTDLGWQSPVRGYVVNHTDLVLLNVSFSHDGIYKCRLLTHSKVEIKETSAYLHVILPLSEIKISKATTGDVITDGAVIEVLHGEETDVECAVVGKVYPPVSLRLQTSANNINASIARVRGSSSAAKLNISQLARVQNITCRADQIVAGRSYKMVEATFTIKRLDPRIAIANCLDPIDSQPGDCCVIGVSSNVSKISGSMFNLSCEAQNTATPWHMKLFRVSDDQVDEEEESSFDGYAISVVDVPIDKNSKWLCVATHSLDESINRSICVETTDSPAVGYGKSNLHKRHLIIGSTFAGLVIIVAMIVLIVFFIRKRRARSTVFKAYDPDYTYNIIAPSVDMDNPPLNDQGPAIWSRLPPPPPPSLRA